MLYTSSCVPRLNIPVRKYIYNMISVVNESPEIVIVLYHVISDPSNVIRDEHFQSTCDVSEQYIAYVTLIQGECIHKHLQTRVMKTQVHEISLTYDYVRNVCSLRLALCVLYSLLMLPFSPVTVQGTRIQ